jgi:hypothetical protein
MFAEGSDNAFFVQKAQHEIAHEVFAYRRQESGAQSQTPRADADIRRATADISGEALSP